MYFLIRQSGMHDNLSIMISIFRKIMNLVSINQSALTNNDNFILLMTNLKIMSADHLSKFVNNILFAIESCILSISWDYLMNSTVNFALLSMLLDKC